MLYWTSHQLMTSVGAKIGSLLEAESCLLQTRNMSCARNSTRSCIVWAWKRDSLLSIVPTALLSTSSARRCRRYGICVLNGAADNSRTSSSYSLPSSQTPLNPSWSTDPTGRPATMNVVVLFSVCYQVSHITTYFLFFFGVFHFFSELSALPLQ